MEDILKRMKCFECKEILQSPIILPCFKTVCNKHVPKQGTFFCKPCQRHHFVPINGFAPNMAMKDLVDSRLPEYKRALGSCELVKSTIGRLERLKNEPGCLIEEIIGELKDRIRLRRQELIEEVEDRFDQELIELEMYERECAASLASLSTDLDRIGKEIEKKRIDLVKSQSKLKEFEADELANWKKITDINELDVSRLTKIIDDFKLKLLLNKFEIYEKKKRTVCSLKLSDITDSNEK